jgi:hypothetical protein
LSDLDPIHGLLAHIDDYLEVFDDGGDVTAKRHGLDMAIARVKRMLRAAPVLTDKPVRWIDGDPDPGLDDKHDRILDALPSR